MIDNNSKENAIWPMPKFYFQVDFGTEMKGVAFQEVSGMDTESQIIEYRKTNSQIFSTEKMPGIVKYGNVTLKRGIFANNNTFWDWHQKISMNTIKRTTVFINLRDEKGNITMQWELQNAWPTKITSTDLKSDGNEVAVDTLEISYEQLMIKNGK